jgi:2-haloacid dehalogenase
VTINATTLIQVFDRHEHELEAEKPHRSFRTVASASLRRAMTELGLQYQPDDIDLLTSSISKMPPFPEVRGALADLKQMGFRLEWHSEIHKLLLELGIDRCRPPWVKDW